MKASFGRWDAFGRRLLQKASIGKPTTEPDAPTEDAPPLSKAEKAAATKRRNLARAVAVIREVVDADERELVSEALLKDGWAISEAAGWLREVFVPKARGNNQPTPRPMTEGAILCPVTGSLWTLGGASPRPSRAWAARPSRRAS